MLWAIAFMLSQALGMIALSRKWVGPPFSYAVAVAPLIAGFLYIRRTIGDMRRQMDELQLRIYMEAASVTLYGLFLILMVYPLFEKAHLVGSLDYSVVLFLLVGLFIAGYFNAARRYR